MNEDALKLQKKCELCENNLQLAHTLIKDIKKAMKYISYIDTKSCESFLTNINSSLDKLDVDYKDAYKELNNYRDNICIHNYHYNGTYPNGSCYKCDNCGKEDRD
jgi:hypothetical protein